MDSVFTNANQAFEKSMLELYYNPEYKSSPRGQFINEITNTKIVIKNPSDNIVYNLARKISTKYLVAEYLWYLLGRQDKEGSDFIVKYAKFWDSIRNYDGSLNSNYGYYIFNPMNEICSSVHNGKNYYKSQIEYICDCLKEDKDSRQALININSIFHKSIDDIKDFPCTTSMHFMIRNNRLNLTVHMRSCDIVLGFCNDVFQFTEIQKLVRWELKKKYRNLKLGTYTLFANSLHLYERNFSMAKNLFNRISNQIYIDSSNSPYTRDDAISVLLHNEETTNTHLKWMKEQLGDIND